MILLKRLTWCSFGVELMVLSSSLSFAWHCLMFFYRVISYSSDFSEELNSGSFYSTISAQHCKVLILLQSCDDCILKLVVAQLCPTLSLPISSIHGILQVRILEWVAIPFSRGSPYPGIKSGSSALQVDSLQSEPPGKPI